MLIVVESNYISEMDDNMGKKFVFITHNIHVMGGTQNYVRSKMKYLIEKDWKVYTIYLGDRKQKECEFKELEPYVNGGVRFLHIPLGSVIGTEYFRMFLHDLLEIIEYKEEKSDFYLIESHAEQGAAWGEILAKTVRGKHIFFCCNERFRGEDKHYIDYMDFCEFKYNRSELAGISDISLKMLFDGYKEIEPSERYKLVAACEDTVQDVPSSRVETLTVKDWNIAYIGRCVKEYFPFIVDDVQKFSEKHYSKEIQFVIVGDVYEQERKLLEKLKKNSNLTVVCLGTFAPIPKRLFDKLDVVIAGSGCCVLSYQQGVPTIVADAKTYKASGIYGYSTTSPIYGDKEYSYVELLEDILITKNYLKCEKANLKSMTAKKAYDEFFEFVEKSCQAIDYYNFDASNVEKGKGEEDKAGLLIWFLDTLKDHSKLKRLFEKYIVEKCGNDISLFGYGNLGRLLTSNVPSLSIKRIYDNNVKEKGVIKPIKELLSNDRILLISPVKKRKEIIEEINQKSFSGEVVFLCDIVENFLDEFFDYISMKN